MLREVKASRGLIFFGLDVMIKGEGEYKEKRWWSCQSISSSFPFKL